MAAADAAPAAGASAPSGSATVLVSLGGLRDRAFELASFTAQHAFPGAEDKEARNTFQNSQCKEAVAAKDFAGFVDVILAHNGAVFASGSEDNVKGYFTLLFSFLRDIDAPAQHDAVVGRLIASLTGSGEAAPLRLNILADLYNMLPAGGDLRFGLFVTILQYAAAQGLVDTVAPFFAAAAEAGKTALTPAQYRTLLAELSAALDAAGDADGAQTYRIAYLTTFQGEPATVLATAQGEAVAAATGYFKAPLVSQKSNLPTLDAVVALQSTPATERVYRLLMIFAAGRVSDYAAFVAEGDNAGWMEGMGVDPVGSAATIKLLTLASLGSTAASLPYGDVATALQVPLADVEEWVVRAVGRGLLDAKCNQETSTVTISRSTAREFGEPQWAALATKLTTWRDNIDGVLGRLRSARLESAL